MATQLGSTQRPGVASSTVGFEDIPKFTCSVICGDTAVSTSDWSAGRSWTVQALRLPLTDGALLARPASSLGLSFLIYKTRVCVMPWSLD